MAALTEKLPDVTLDEVEDNVLCFGLADAALFDTFDQAGRGMMTGIPLVHRVQQFTRLAHQHNRSLLDDVQRRVGDDRGNLQDSLFLRIEPTHFEIHPDQVFREGHSASSSGQVSQC